LGDVGHADWHTVAMNVFFRTTWLGVLGAFVCAGFVACGSSDDTTTPSDGGALDNDAISGDANPPNGDGSVGGDASTPPYAIITLSQWAPTAYSLSADFTAGGVSPCVTTNTSGCSITVCTYPAAAADAGGGSPFVPPNAGDITVTGMRDAGPVVITYGELGDSGIIGYATQNGNALFFQGGDTVTATGAGGPDLPSFGPQSAVAPDAIVLTSPVCTGSSCADLDRTTDLAVTWTGGGTGTLHAFFESVVTSPSPFFTAIDCPFDSSAHAGTVPSAVLMNLAKTGDPGVSANAESFTPSTFVGFTLGADLGSFNLEGQGVQKSYMTVSK
ncbi:MAG: hypothetical protein ACRELY_08545, partial [Polyangiaceae bacterium]